MMNLTKKVLKKVANVSLSMAESSMNKACFIFYHQPEVPKQLKKD